MAGVPGSVVAVFSLVYGIPLVVATVAVWRPRPWQVGLLLVGPVLMATGPIGYLTWVVVPYATLTVMAILPWRKRWALYAFPCMTLAASAAVMIALREEGASVVMYLLPPMLLAVGALFVHEVNRRDRQRARSAQVADV